MSRRRPVQATASARGARPQIADRPTWLTDVSPADVAQFGAPVARAFVLAFGAPRGAWARSVAAALDPVAEVRVSERVDVIASLARRAAVCLVHGDCEDPVRMVAEVWGAAPHLNVILAADGLSEETRAAAYEAGVACIIDPRADAQELRALVRMTMEQNLRGSPEVLRAVCHAMAALSAAAIATNDRAFVDVAVREVARVFNAERVSVQLRDARGELRVRGSVGVPLDAYDRPRTSGVADGVATSGQPRIILRELEPPPSAATNGRVRAISASLCVPLIEQHAVNGRVLGVINVARTRPHAVFTPRDLQLAMSLAGIIAEGLGGIEARVRAAESMRQLAVAEKLSTVGELAAGVAHEVANPISCVRANTQALAGYLAEITPLLRGVTASRPELREILEDLPAVLDEIQEGIGRAEDVVRHMKSLVRLEDATSREDAVAISQVVRSTTRFLRARVPNLRLCLDEGAFVRGSPAELSQLLVNLLANASDACSERTASCGPEYKAMIEIAVKRVGSDVQIVVSDNGAGMTEETASRIFMPLFTTKSAERGTGLGLPIVRRLVERHGGVIRVSSEVGVGTCFTITLPAMSGPGDARAECAPASTGSSVDAGAPASPTAPAAISPTGAESTAALAVGMDVVLH